MGRVEIVPGTEADLAVASAILTEAAQWLIDRGQPLWEPADLVPARVRELVRDGSLHLAMDDGEAVGTLALQWEDPVFWPDATPGESAFVHRLAVRRAVAGTGVAHAMLDWAVGEAARAGCTWLRLDCSADHPGLIAYYERLEFEQCGRRAFPEFEVVLLERPTASRSAP